MARSVDTPRRHAHLSVQRAPLINPCPVPSLASVPRKLHEPSAGTPVAPLNHFNEAAAFQLRNPCRTCERLSRLVASMRPQRFSCGILPERLRQRARRPASMRPQRFSCGISGDTDSIFKLAMLQ